MSTPPPRQIDAAALETLAAQVRRNCQRADAEVAGHFSLCGLLLRLRNLYKWEHGLPPWREPYSAPVLDWVSQREELWLEIMEEDPQPLRLDGQVIDPFDSPALNELLDPCGLVYGAGRAGGLLPAFFLGRLETRWQEDGLTVHQVGEELARDIYFLPGLRQDGCIYLRREPLAYLLWDKLADPRASLGRFVDLGLAGYGLTRRELMEAPSWELLAPLLEGEMCAVCWHELGEALDAGPARPARRWALAEHPASELEHFVRGVGDLLADTGPHGRLARIIAAQARGALGLYPAWLAGFPRMLFPEADAAVLQFSRDGDWAGIEQARLLGWRRGLEAVERLAPFQADEAPAEELRRRVRAQVIEPLTGSRPLPARPD